MTHTSIKQFQVVQQSLEPLLDLEAVRSSGNAAEDARCNAALLDDLGHRTKVARSPGVQHCRLSSQHCSSSCWSSAALSPGLLINALLTRAATLPARKGLFGSARSASASASGPARSEIRDKEA
jgi:hypothetical protein